MPVISFVSSKGGVGKSTAVLVLAAEFARAGASRVTIVDADPNQPIAAWANLPNKPETVSVIGGVTEETVIDVIDAEAAVAPFVLVDLEGTASMVAAYAISRSDLVVIPCQGSHLDAREASKAVRLIRRNEHAFQRRIPHAVLVNRCSAAFVTRGLKHILGEFERHEVPVLQTQLMEREAFKALFAIGGSLYELTLDDVRNPEAAQENAQALAREVYGRVQADAAEGSGRL